MKKYIVTLTEGERGMLGELTKKGKHGSQKILNAPILVCCDEGEFQDRRPTNHEIAQIPKIGMKKIDRVKKRFVEEGIDIALNGRRGSRIYKKMADGDFEAHLIALSCGKPPEGHARWTLRLLAEKAVELNYADSVSHETVRRVLKKTKPNHGKAKGGQFRPNKTAVLLQTWRCCWIFTNCLVTGVIRLSAWTNPRGS
jgi:transposase